ncbi:hypothetical protein [Nostoc sp. TCL26-01]|uniref:hypothetical protein n=1 Tax=Nostoc sp. TCL26-01 TaxID=2576904 RepID=UPI0015B86979|nr:hypothetical protein [Nostoc sp. TCL26-01]QLE58806.1 hypothetical protein FD725_26870 [Nostoc sp. TCL26-01]
MTPSHKPNSRPNEQRLISQLLWLLSALYIYILLLSPPGQLLPGEPVWAIQPQTLQEIWHESLNFFFILPILNAVGVANIPIVIVHPWLESLFNLAEAWMLMFLPLMLADSRGEKLPKFLIWGLAMFLTNTFLIPYMAVRAINPLVWEKESPQKNLLARILGCVGLIVGTMAIFWLFFGRSEVGSLAERYNYFLARLMSDRLTIAFCVDLILFAIFQAVIIGEIEPIGSRKRWLRFIPFWGLVAWLII